MIDIVQLDGRTFVLGDIKQIGLYNIRLRYEDTLTVTATVRITNSAGTETLAATAMTITGGGTVSNNASYLLQTGAGKTITVADTYKAMYTVTNGSEVFKFQQVLTVLADPF